MTTSVSGVPEGLPLFADHPLNNQIPIAVLFQCRDRFIPRTFQVILSRLI